MKNPIKDRKDLDVRRLGERLRDAVVEDYLQTGKCLDVKRIASQLRWSETKVRRVLDLQPGGTPDGITVLRDGRGWVYMPTLWHLRGMVLDLRTKLRDATPGADINARFAPVNFDIMGGPADDELREGDFDNGDGEGHDEYGKPL